MSGKEDLYDLFEHQSGEQTPRVKEAPFPAHTLDVGRLAVRTSNDLYDLDFSTLDSAEPNNSSNAVALDSSRRALPESSDQMGVVEQIIYPDAILKRFEELMGVIDEQDYRVKFSLVDMERLTQHFGRFSSEERWYFKQYCKQNTALEYFGDNMFGLAARVTPDSYWPQELDISPELDLAGLVEATVEIMAMNIRVRGRKYPIKNIMGIVKSQGFELYTDEFNEFIALLTQHEKVTPLENGSYYVAYEGPLDTTDVHGRQEIESSLIKTSKKYNVIVPKDVTRAIQQINRSDELKRARDLAKNYADVRRLNGRHSKKRRGKRMQGRAHGKKQSFDQTLKQSIANLPQQEVSTQESQDGSSES